MEKEEFKKAINLLNKVIKSDSNSVEHLGFYCLRGVAYMQLKKFKNAINDFEKTIDNIDKIELSDNEKSRPYACLYKIYKDLNQPQKAAEYLAKAKKLGYVEEK